MFLKPFNGFLMLNIFFKLIVLLLSIMTPLLFSSLINSLVLLDLTKVISSGLIFVLVNISIIFLHFLVRKYEVWLSNKVYLYSNAKIHDEILNMKIRSLELYSPGKLFNLVTKDILSYFSHIQTSITICLHLFSVVMIIIVSFSINIWVTLCLFLSYPVLFRLSSVYRRKLKKISQKNQMINDDYIGFLKNVTSNIKDVIVQNGQSKVLKILNKKYASLNSNTKSMQEMTVQNGILVNYIASINYIVITVLAIFFIFSGQLNIGQFIALTTYSKQITSTFDSIIQAGNNLTPIHVSIDRVEDLTNLSKKPTNVISESPNEDLVIKNLQLSKVSLFRKNKLILKDISLTFDVGNSYGVYGENGTGKSTFAQFLTGLIPDYTGDVYINKNIALGDDIEILFDKVGLVTNECTIYDVSIIDFLTLHAQDDVSDYSRIFELCEIIGIHDDIQKLPMQYNTMLSSLTTLSTGQMQKVQLARVLIRNHPVIIIDEAFSAIDLHSKSNILRYLHENLSNKLLIIVSHDQSDLSLCNHRILAKNYRLIANENP